MASNSSRKDFLTTLVRKVEEGEVSKEELTAHASTLVWVILPKPPPTPPKTLTRWPDLPEEKLFQLSSQQRLTIFANILRHCDTFSMRFAPDLKSMRRSTRHLRCSCHIYKQWYKKGYVFILPDRKGSHAYLQEPMWMEYGCLQGCV